MATKGWKLANNFSRERASCSWKGKRCVYCGTREHRTNDCTKVLTLADCREHLKSNKHYFNCTCKKQNAVSCRSRGCLECGGKHHTSICGKIHSTIPEVNRRPSQEKGFNETVATGATLHAMLKGVVRGQEIRIMIDTGASSKVMIYLFKLHIQI